MRSAAILLLLLTATAAAQDKTNRSVDIAQLIETYAVRSQAERGDAIKSNYRVIEEWKRDRTKEKEERLRMIAAAETRIVNLEDPRAPFFPTAHFDLTSPKAEDIGFFDGKGVGILQVIDAKNAVLDIRWGERYMTGVRTIGETQIPTYGGRTRTAEIWLANYPTDGMVDDKGTRLTGVFAVTGTKTYVTGEGTHTVPLLEHLDMKPYEAKFSRMSAIRKWKSANGDHTTDAVFVRYRNGKVTMMKGDGKSIEVPLEKLSDDDARFVREWIKSANSK